MLVTLGTLRHQLAVDYDLPANVRQFVRRLARQQSLALLDPRRTFDRLYDATGRMQRALAFVEFLEAQQPVITEATSMLFGYRNRIRRVKTTADRIRRRRPRRRRVAVPRSRLSR